jgi:hypothetical protein
MQGEAAVKEGADQQKVGQVPKAERNKSAAELYLAMLPPKSVAC